jgi:hypothetical protein
MRTATRLSWLLTAVVAAAACGDQNLGIPRSAQVSALEDADAIEVCEEFVTLFCRDAPAPPYDGFCTPCVLDELCGSGTLVATMDAECAGVTVGQVRDCAEGRTEGLCAPATGGCMLGVSDALCP